MKKYIRLLILFLCLLTSINCFARPKKRLEPQTIEEK